MPGVISKAMPVSSASINARDKLDQVIAAYECYDHHHAIAILTMDFPELLSEICDVLLAFRITIENITKAGGNESQIPKNLSKLLRPLDWQEKKLEAKLVVDERTVSSDTHKIDYV